MYVLSPMPWPFFEASFGAERRGPTEIHSFVEAALIEHSIMKESARLFAGAY